MSTVKTAGHEHHYAHHFDNAEHEYNTTKLGTWMFLVTEIVMFGGLFVGYIIYHGLYHDMFHEGSTFLNWRLGALNTVILLVSSLTMALSIYYAQLERKGLVLFNLYTTLACGFGFLSVKYIEYTHKFHEGLFPGKYFNPHEPEVQAITKHLADTGAGHLGQYFSFYFVMTGLHGSHVIIGMGLITWLIIRTHRGEFNHSYYTPLECVGLFWHLVDLIWIYLFPLLYLIG